MPELTDDLLDRIVAQSDRRPPAARSASSKRLRDECLVAVLQALRAVGFGAGEIVADHGERLRRWQVSSRRAGPAATASGVVRHPRHLTVTWDDGHRGEFHHRWLRDNCACSACRHPQTGERLLDTFALDPDVAPVGLTVSDRSILVDWTDGHASELDLAWLRRHGAPGSPAPSGSHRRHWGAETADDLPEFAYVDLIAGDDELAAFMAAVRSTGIAFVRAAPANEEALASLAGRVGTVRRTNFGPDFHVEAVAEPNNVAYTAVELRPHTDLPYHEYPPGIQFLHCFVADAPGGESTLADGFWVADRVRAVDRTPSASCARPRSRIALSTSTPTCASPPR